MRRIPPILTSFEPKHFSGYPPLFQLCIRMTTPKIRIVKLKRGLRLACASGGPPYGYLGTHMPPGLAGAGSPAALSESGGDGPVRILPSGAAMDPRHIPTARSDAGRPRRGGELSPYAGLELKLPVMNAAGRLQISARRFSARTAILFFVK
jgi:hypothetical protein